MSWCVLEVDVDLQKLIFLHFYNWAKKLNIVGPKLWINKAGTCLNFFLHRDYNAYWATNVAWPKKTIRASNEVSFPWIFFSISGLWFQWFLWILWILLKIWSLTLEFFGAWFQWFLWIPLKIWFQWFPRFLWIPF